MAVPGGPMPWVKSQFLTRTGDAVAAGYLLYVYDAGTSSEATTYVDKDRTSENANPVVLDSAGRASVFLDRSQAYKMVLVPSADTADPPTSPVWTQDIVQSVPFYAIDDSVTYDEISQIGWSRSDSSQVLQSPHRPAILYSKYANSSSGTGNITIPAGTLDPILSTIGDGLVLEWEATYSSATLSARSTAFGTNVDLGTGSASTATRAKYVIYRVSSTSVHVSATVIQDTGAGNAQVAMSQQTIGSLTLDSTDYTVDMTMASGTFTVRGARAYFGKSFGDWTAL